MSSDMFTSCKGKQRRGKDDAGLGDKSRNLCELGNRYLLEIFDSVSPKLPRVRFGGLVFDNILR